MMMVMRVHDHHNPSLGRIKHCEAEERCWPSQNCFILYCDLRLREPLSNFDLHPNCSFMQGSL
jgi:hypothetical protein